MRMSRETGWAGLSACVSLQEQIRIVSSNSGAVLPMDDLLPLVHWDLNTDRTSKISFFGALPWIARNIQDAFGVAMTD